MTSKAKNTAIVLGGAIALSFGAYALGTQTGGGTAAAGGGAASTAAGSSSDAARPTLVHRRFGPGGGPAGFFGGLEELADELGVNEEQLRTALRDAREDLPGPDRDREGHLSELAAALGVTEAK